MVYLAATAAFSKTPSVPRTNAIVSVDTASLRTGPSLDHSVISPIYKGRWMKVLGASGDWRHVKLASGTKGWVHQDLLRVLTPTATAVRFSRSVASRSSSLIRTAMGYRGTPYRFGARGGGAFDCSGFTSHLFAKAGSPLPRTAAEQFERGVPVSRDELKPGDLVFFKNTYKHGVSHVGMFVGDGKFIHASSRGGVRVDSLSGSYYLNHWAGARRRL